MYGVMSKIPKHTLKDIDNFFLRNAFKMYQLC